VCGGNVNRHRSANFVEVPVVIVRAMILEEDGRRSSTLLALSWTVMTRSGSAGLWITHWPQAQIAWKPRRRNSLRLLH
jgi:hypothetical protein